MDKTLILAVAGAGKTTLLVNNLNEKERFLLLTYTDNNYNNLKIAIVNKFGYIPNNIKIYTYFSFLFNFCFRPFEMGLNTKGIDFINRCENMYLKDTQKPIIYIITTNKCTQIDWRSFAVNLFLMI